MNKKNILLIISIFALITLILSIGNHYYSNDKASEKSIAIKVETEKGSNIFKNYLGEDFPTTGYTFDGERSFCNDKDGNRLEIKPTYDSTTNKVKVLTTRRINCYVYFKLN